VSFEGEIQVEVDKKLRSCPVSKGVFCYLKKRGTFRECEWNV
jgi:hypothetical protein